MFKNKKVLLFDLDGTLVDSVPDLADAVNVMLKQLNLATFTEATIRNWVGNGAWRLVERALGTQEASENISDKDLTHAHTLFLEAYKNTLSKQSKIYPNVNTTLQTLKTRGYTLAIITNKPEKFVEPLLKKLELYNYFSLFLGGDSLACKKPDPLPLAHALKTLDFSVAQSIMIGDSKNDITAANALGMQSIAVSYGYNYSEPIEDCNPSVVIDNFNEILGLLDG